MNRRVVDRITNVIRYRIVDSAKESFTSDASAEVRSFVSHKLHKTLRVDAWKIITYYVYDQ